MNTKMKKILFRGAGALLMAGLAFLVGVASEINAKSKIILVTAFGPFGGEKINPTEKILGKLPDTIGGYTIKKLLLPVEFARSAELAFARYDELSPAAVIMLGQAGGRSAITPETTGRNVMNSHDPDKVRPDNAGYAPDHLSIVKNGPAVLKSTFSAEKIVEVINALGIPGEVSDDAGEFVCNNLLYSMLDHNKGKVPTGLIHVPYAKEQGHEDQPFMEVNEMYKGIVAAIETVAASL